METSSIFTGSSAPSDTISGSNAQSAPAPITSVEATTQIIPGTTVIGTGSTGDVWSYTIPDVTTTYAPSLTVPPASQPAPTPSPLPESSLVFTDIIVTGTTVIGGQETGVPWSYTIPAATIVSSFYIPISTSPIVSPLPTDLIATHSESLPASPSTTASPVPPPPPPEHLPTTSEATLSGGIVAAILGGLFLLIFAIAGLLCFRLRRRRRRVGTDWDGVKGDKGVGVVWGHGWGSEGKGIGAWRRMRPGMPKNGSGGSGEPEQAESGLGGPASVRHDFGPIPNGSAELLARRGPPSLLHVPNTSQPDWNGSDTRTPTDIAYPTAARYPHTHNGSNTNMHTRMTTRPPHDTHAFPDETNTPTAGPSGKQKRVPPPPSQFIYAPPPPAETPEPSPIATISPHTYRPTSPFSYRPTSPYGLNAPPQNVPKRLSKQRATPSASAFLRHMVHTRPSFRRPKASQYPPSSAKPMASIAPSTSASGTTTPSEVSRPNISTLPSFIRERQFYPARHSNAFTSSESALFSPSPRPGQLPPHSPRLPNRSSPALLLSPQTRTSPLATHPPHSRSAFTTSRDGLLSPPHAGGRDRYSQMTSTTRSSRMTGRSGDTRATGRSGESRVTGRSGGASRTGGLAQIAEGVGEPRPRVPDTRRRREAVDRS